MGGDWGRAGVDVAPVTRTVKHPAVVGIIAALINVPMLLARSGTLAEPDTFWQIRTGLLILQNGSIPQTDPFSWTAYGEPWNVNSWAFDVLLGASYGAAGLPGAAYFSAALAGAACVVVLIASRRLGASASIAGAFVFMASPALVAWFSARPQLTDYVAVPLLVLLLQKIVSGETRWGGVLWVMALAIAWVNLHAAVLLGVLIVGAAVALTSVIPQYRSRVWWCLAALAGCVAGALVNPYGIGLIGQTLQVGTSSSGIIAEWMPLASGGPDKWAMFAAGVVALVLAALRRDAVYTAALLVLAATSMEAMRTLPILLLTSLPILTAAASRPAVLGYLRSRRIVFIPGAIVAVLVFTVLFASRGLTHPGTPDPALYSVSVVNALPSGAKVFNSYEIGGFILLERPDVRVSFDSRNDLYGAQRTLAFEKILSGHGDPSTDLAGADSVLVPPTSGLADQLGADSRWKRGAGDGAAVLYLRR